MGFMKKSTGFALRPFNGRRMVTPAAGGNGSVRRAFSGFAPPATDPAGLLFQPAAPLPAEIAAFRRDITSP
jgi:hypothetical protein